MPKEVDILEFIDKARFVIEPGLCATYGSNDPAPAPFCSVNVRCRYFSYYPRGVCQFTGEVVPTELVGNTRYGSYEYHRVATCPYANKFIEVDARRVLYDSGKNGYAFGATKELLKGATSYLLPRIPSDRFGRVITSMECDKDTLVKARELLDKKAKPKSIEEGSPEWVVWQELLLHPGGMTLADIKQFCEINEIIDDVCYVMNKLRRTRVVTVPYGKAHTNRFFTRTWG